MRSGAHLSSHPIHHMLVTLPLGLWIGSFAFDVIGAATGKSLIYAAGFYAASGGIIAAILAATAGAIDYFTVVPPASSAKKRGAVHGILNTLAWLAFLSVVIHRGGAEFAPDKISILVSLVAVAVLGYSAWLGGTLSYRNQVGVDRRYARASKLKERSLDSWERPICNQNELSAGQIILARIADRRIAVAKCSEGMVALERSLHAQGWPTFRWSFDRLHRAMSMAWLSV